MGWKLKFMMIISRVQNVRILFILIRASTTRAQFLNLNAEYNVDHHKQSELKKERIVGSCRVISNQLLDQSVALQKYV